jgi:hypothetical protein
MRKIMVCFFLLLSVFYGSAQVVINPQIPALGLVLKSQLWSLVLINTSNHDMQVQLQILLVDAGNNQRILSGSTKTFTLSKGGTQITASEVAPVTYNVLSPGYNVDASPEGFLPVGRFNICYSVVQFVEAGAETIAEDCENITIEPIAPPQLVSPSDSETVEISRPLFQWLPPTPLSMFNNLSYDFNLVEVQHLQSSSEALQQNIPLQSQQNLNVTNLQYPVSLPELDTGKIYAWRITARSNGSSVSESETWTFRIKKNKDSVISYKMGFYAKLKSFNSAGYVVCDGNLKFEYQNQYNDKQVQFRIYDITTPKQTGLKTDSVEIAVRFGQNLLALDLGNAGLLSNKHIYLLELINSKNERWYLKFEYRKQN